MVKSNINESDCNQQNKVKVANTKYNKIIENAFKIFINAQFPLYNHRKIS